MKVKEHYQLIDGNYICRKTKEVEFKMSLNKLIDDVVYDLINNGYELEEKGGVSEC